MNWFFYGNIFLSSGKKPGDKLTLQHCFRSSTMEGKIACGFKIRDFFTRGHISSRAQLKPLHKNNIFKSLIKIISDVSEFFGLSTSMPLRLRPPVGTGFPHFRSIPRGKHRKLYWKRLKMISMKEPRKSWEGYEMERESEISFSVLATQKQCHKRTAKRFSVIISPLMSSHWIIGSRMLPFPTLCRFITLG